MNHYSSSKKKRSPQKTNWRSDEEWRAYVIRKYGAGKAKEANMNKIGKPFIEDLKASISRCVKNSEALLEGGGKFADTHLMSATASSFMKKSDISTAYKPVNKSLNCSESRISISNHSDHLFTGIIDKIRKNVSRPSSCKNSSENRYSRIRRSLDERYKGSSSKDSSHSTLKDSMSTMTWTRTNSLRKPSTSSKVQERLNFLETKISSIRDKFSKASRSCYREGPGYVSEFRANNTEKKGSIKMKFEENRFSKRREADEILKEKVRQLKAMGSKSKEKENLSQESSKSQNFESIYKSSPKDSRALLKKAQEYITQASSKLVFSGDHSAKVISQTKLGSNVKGKPLSSPYYYHHILNLLYFDSNPEDKSSTYPSLVQEHFHLSFQVLSHAKNLLNLPRMQDLKKIHLPQIRKPTLILDMDETLLHCSTGIIEGADTVLDLKIPGSDPCKVSVFLRPHLYESLEQMSKDYELVVFTASHAAYANMVLDFVDFKRKYIKHRIFRDYCVLANDGMFVKDLRIIVNREIENILIVDNSAHCFAFQPENGIPIVPFYFDRTDSELPLLVKYVRSLAKSNSNKTLKYENNERLSMSTYSNYGTSVDFLENEFSSEIQKLKESTQNPEK